MKYQLRIFPRAQRQLRRLPNRVRSEVIELIVGLQYEPLTPQAEPLRDHYSDLFKIKVNGWRIFYKVHESDRVVTVISVKRRDPNTYAWLYSIPFFSS